MIKLYGGVECNRNYGTRVGKTFLNGPPHQARKVLYKLIGDHSHNIVNTTLTNARPYCRRERGRRVAVPRDECEFCPSLRFCDVLCTSSRFLKNLSSHLPKNDT
ncbi:hypothetical protein EVAR_30987_1 [Eumeta japonica]|uniref:Uncharacterized protein n=1 Tax=Eumeta variegata TaxID=151549 RepID=A0A4C1W9Z2_EUMVA|nr:hypothetical protein EVAR_30987_1 [Eumeta japonica]